MDLELPESVLHAMEARIQRYPQKRSAVLPLLHLIQEHKGYISQKAMQWIAQRLDMQPIEVQELVTFYPMLHQKPCGHVHVRVCRTLSCALQGSAQVLKTLEKALNCPAGSTHPTGSVSLEFFECLANCHGAPVVMVNEVLHADVTPERLQALVEEIKKEIKMKG